MAQSNECPQQPSWDSSKEEYLRRWGFVYRILGTQLHHCVENPMAFHVTQSLADFLRCHFQAWLFWRDFILLRGRDRDFELGASSLCDCQSSLGRCSEGFIPKKRIQSGRGNCSPADCKSVRTLGQPISKASSILMDHLNEMPHAGPTSHPGMDWLKLIAFNT